MHTIYAFFQLVSFKLKSEEDENEQNGARNGPYKKFYGIAADVKIGIILLRCVRRPKQNWNKFYAETCNLSDFVQVQTLGRTNCFIFLYFG